MTGRRAHYSSDWTLAPGPSTRGSGRRRDPSRVAGGAALLLTRLELTGQQVDLRTPHSELAGSAPATGLRPRPLRPPGQAGGGVGGQQGGEVPLTRTIRKVRCSGWCNRGTRFGRRCSVPTIPVDLSASRDVHRYTSGAGWRQALPWSGRVRPRRSRRARPGRGDPGRGLEGSHAADARVRGGAGVRRGRLCSLRSTGTVGPHRARAIRCAERERARRRLHTRGGRDVGGNER